MQEFILFIESNIVALLSVLTGGNIVLIAATVVKTFSQKNLNRSFDLFRAGTQGMLNTNKSVEQLLGGMNGVVRDVKNSVEVLTEQVKALDTTKMFEVLEQSVRELETLKKVIEIKDELIESYQKDFHAIAVKIQELEGRSGYTDEVI